MSNLPDFFIIGFQKCATSSLHHILKSSKQVSLPIYKETHFFSDDIIFKKGINWYRKQFDINKNYKISGEVDPSYIYIDKAAIRIKKFINNPKFILILRKPIDRAYSHYKMSCRRGYEKKTFEEAMMIETERLSSKNKFKINNFSYKDRGNYSKQIKKIKEIFNDSSFLYLDFDFLTDINRKNALIQDIFNFIGLDFDNKLLNLNIHENKDGKIKYQFIQNILYGNNMLRKCLSTIISNDIIKNKIKNFIIQFNMDSDSKVYDDKLNYIHLPNEIKEWNNSEVSKIEKILNKDLSKWKI